MTGRRLGVTVYVADDAGVQHPFGPGADVPAWAEALITNPDAWVSDETPAEASAETPSVEPDEEAALAADLAVLSTGTPEEVMAWLAGNNAIRVITAVEGIADVVERVDVATALLDLEQAEGAKNRKGVKSALQDLIDG